MRLTTATNTTISSIIPILIITLCFLIGCCHSYKLECTSHHMRVTYEIGVDDKVTEQSEIMFENSDCVASRNQTHWTIIAGYHNCSTSVKSTQLFISYMNTVTVNLQTNTPGAIIERHRHVKIKHRLTCHLNRNTNVITEDSFQIG